MSGLSPEELRRGALSALGRHADERARDALLHGDLVLSPAVVSWQASRGRVEGHHVTLAVDGATLGRLRAAPSVVDALHAALAQAIAAHAGEALHELDLRWMRGAVRAVSEGYRDRPPEEETLARALVAYLDASGEPELARRVDEGSVDGDAVEVRVAIDGSAVHEDPHAARTLTRAVHDLAGDNVRVRVVG